VCRRRPGAPLRRVRPDTAALLKLGLDLGARAVCCRSNIDLESVGFRLNRRQAPARPRAYAVAADPLGNKAPLFALLAWRFVKKSCAPRDIGVTGRSRFAGCCVTQRLYQTGSESRLSNCFMAGPLLALRFCNGRNGRVSIAAPVCCWRATPHALLQWSGELLVVASRPGLVFCASSSPVRGHRGFVDRKTFHAASRRYRPPARYRPLQAAAPRASSVRP